MKKINIVKDSKQFQSIIQNNKSYASKYFYLYKEDTKDIYRFGISVPKKIGKAVVRNKYKRRIKHIISKNTYKNGFNCIIILKRNALDTSFSNLEKDLNDAITYLNIKEK